MNKITRRNMLLGSAGFGLVGALPVGRALAQASDLPLPQGSPEKLTVIHRTEYFAQAQEMFAQAVSDFADESGKELDISTTIPEAYGNFLGKMTAAVRAGNPPDIAYTSQISIPQMHVLGLLEDVSDVVEEAERRYGAILPGLSAKERAYFDGGWRAVPFLANMNGTFMRGDKLKEAANIGTIVWMFTGMIIARPPSPCPIPTMASGAGASRRTRAATDSTSASSSCTLSAGRLPTRAAWW